jgi:hypothetical protein
MAKHATRDVIVGTRLTAAQARAVRGLAWAHGMTVAGWIATAIRHAIAEQGEAAQLAEFRGRVVARVIQQQLEEVPQ